MSVSPTASIREFLASLQNLSLDRRQFLDPILDRAIQHETTLRKLFATDLAHSDLIDPYAGLLDIFLVHPDIRRTRSRPLGANKAEFDRQYILPLAPSQRRPHGSPCTVATFRDFLHNWEIFTHSVLSDLPSWTNVLVAGGSVLASLMPAYDEPASATKLNTHYQCTYAQSDIDIFLWGLSPKQAEEKIRHIYQSICKRTAPWDVICVRKANVISIHGIFPYRPIQIILRLYKSPAEILAGFDVDVSGCGFDGFTVWVTPRAFIALIRQANTVDMSRRSPSYEICLAKYAERSFEVYYPQLMQEKITDKIMNPNLLEFPRGLARLLVLERLSQDPTTYKWLHYPGKPFSKEGRRPSMEHQLDDSEYEMVWTKIPYGQPWNAKAILSLVNRVDIAMNGRMSLKKAKRRLHRHTVYAGTVNQCLGDICKNCPKPRNENDDRLIEMESHKYIRGRVKFLDMNAGRQIVSGSFRPINDDEWTAEAYGL